MLTNRVTVFLAVRSRQGTVHLMSRLLEPGTKLSYSNNVNCNQRISGTVIAQAEATDKEATAFVKSKVTCERCNPNLREVN